MKKYFCFLLLLAACREVYEPPVKASAAGLLVVEGYLNSGRGPTEIMLTRTTQVYQTNTVYEKGARVQVESDDNTLVTLTEKDKGVYAADQLNISSTHKYRLRIKTAGNQEYLSDFVAPKNTPPVDSISWIRESDGVHIYINTHDPQNNTRYYRWEYLQTWEYHATFTPTLKWGSELIIPGQSVVFINPLSRSPDGSKQVCWQNNASTSLLLGSTARLSRDVVFLPLVFIPNRSRQLGVLYSIRVKQYAISREAYEFLEKMKKNTELTGSVFDPQPSGLTGNIRCVSNPGEAVIGFVSICPVEEKRIFIRNSEVPDWNYSPGCTVRAFENKREDIDTAVNLGLIPTTPVVLRPDGSVGYFNVATGVCVDCTFTGTNIKPDFWP